MQLMQQKRSLGVHWQSHDTWIDDNDESSLSSNLKNMHDNYINTLLQTSIWNHVMISPTISNNFEYHQSYVQPLTPY